MNLSKVIINIAIFQAGWLGCVLGASHGLPWLGPVLALPVIGWHMANADRPGDELRFVLLATLLGGLFDQLLLAMDLVVFAAVNGWPSALLPPWMIALWLMFSTTPAISLRWLRGRFAVAAFLGLLCAPLAYIAGAGVGALFLTDMPFSLLAIGLGWAVIMPTLMQLHFLLGGYTGNARETAGAMHHV